MYIPPNEDGHIMITLHPHKKVLKLWLYWPLDCWGRRGKEKELQVLSPARKRDSKTAFMCEKCDIGLNANCFKGWIRFDFSLLYFYSISRPALRIKIKSNESWAPLEKKLGLGRIWFFCQMPDIRQYSARHAGYSGRISGIRQKKSYPAQP